ncbi:MAG: UDP-N-acetylglucosamine 2-epimerase (non-hydrolyzing) [Patescibacteria group bacterium]|jgi:UDP-N-acetylglucosamine 2-epimerase (non-hydrolysing)
MILLFYGTRPEYIKISPLLKVMKEEGIPHRILFTGQHEDICGGTFDCRINIINGPNRLDSIVQSLLNLSDKIFDGIKYVLVQGDTSSAMAIAMSAFHHNIPIIHLEAGLRTYDIQNPYPEEFNRQIISKISNIHLCPTHTNQINLNNEGIYDNIYVTGNTGLDNLVDIKTEYNNDIVVTLHRRENHKILPLWFNIINDLACEYKKLNFIIPLHPNPNVQLHKHILTDVIVTAPLLHEDMIQLISKCKFIISDSGGLQEESSFLNKKIIVCRKVTERTETLGKNSLLCKDPSELRDIFCNIINDYIITEKCPYGDGNSSKRVAEIFKQILQT